MSSVNEMLLELNDHGFSDTSTARKVDLIQDTIWEIEALEPWPFLETSINLNFDGTSPIPTNWPDNFRASIRVKDLSNGRRIMPLRLDDFEDVVGMDYARKEAPRVYYFEGSQLYLWPIPPASTGRLKFRYLRYSERITSTSPETDIILPKQHHRAIVLGALVKLNTMEDDSELAGGFQAQMDEKIARMRSALWQRNFDQSDTIRTTDWEEWDYMTV